MLLNNTTGVNNTATGSTSLLNNSTGNHNTANGARALFLNTTGSSNIAIGRDALIANTSGNFNIAIGTGAGSQITDAFNCIAIGHQGGNVNQSCFIGNVRGAVVAPDAVPVLIDSAGKLGTTGGSFHAMLRNEFLKGHPKVEEQEATIADLKSAMAQQRKETEALVARMKQQEALIQKVSAQIEMLKPDGRMVADSH